MWKYSSYSGGVGARRAWSIFAALEVKPSLDQIVGEHVAGGQEVVVLFQGVQGRVEGARHLLDVGVLFGRSS